ncbi:MAG: type VI secretion system ATPase TssH [Fibrobacteria bacterium]|nr:type VI secretion system ATPase TssH [Fibrobacteria bacterium]
MISISIRNILEKLNPYTQKILEGAVGSCVNRSHYEVTAAHLLAQAYEDGRGDLTAILAHFKVDAALFKTALQRELKELKTGNTSKPVFSPLLLNALELAWTESSLNLKSGTTGTGGLVLAMRKNQGLCGQVIQDQLNQILPEILIKDYSGITEGSQEQTGKNASSVSSNKAGGKLLDQYTVDFTEMAEQGKIDPIFCRDQEILQTIDVLSRRRKNNPIMVGEAGVGKTAVVEGLALKIAEKQVPEMLQNVRLLSLDMGLLSAGAGVRGEFENRLKGLIAEVKNSDIPIILFIDEAHTIIGAGGEAGQNDAANLLKPELARGEIKCLAATTFTEFRKYFEKDPAMARRFQPVTINEPSPEEAAVMLRGLRNKYEQYHGVAISYEAVKAACELSHKFIAGRQLPDKAVDLLDTAAARVKMGLDAPPSSLQALQQQVSNLNIEIQSLEKDTAGGVLHETESLKQAKTQLSAVEKKVKMVTGRWQKELSLVKSIHEDQKELEALSKKTTSKKQQGKRSKLKRELNAKWKKLKTLQKEVPLVHSHVSPELVARIIAEWTGIPAGRVLSDEAETMLKLEKLMAERVKGQSWGINEIADTLRAARTGLKKPETPLGVFLLTGPSGVGKTESALAVADLLFGGEESVVTINMSEYQDSMSVTQLKGASAGYVGYGDGGVLTEGVRKRPYTVVILDEVEKAHKDVLNMFYQVFDKGLLRDGEGRMVNFRNTVILMTSNLGLDTITNMAMDKQQYSYGEYSQAILPELTAHFQPALLARCKVVPFLPLGVDTLIGIVSMKLKKVTERLLDKYGISSDIMDAVTQKIVDNCTVMQSGARAVDTIIDQHLLPDISRCLLESMAGGEFPKRITIDAKKDGWFRFKFMKSKR